MVSKNNKVKKFEQSAQRQNHFSIRKLTVGAASVLLGTSLYFGTQTSQAHAAVNSESDVKTTEVAKSADPASSAAAAKSSAANSVTTSSAASSAVSSAATSVATSSAASSAVSSASSQASSAALSSAANSVATSSAASKDTETTTLKIETNKDANKVDAKKLVKAVKESKAATTDSASGVNPLSVLEDYDDDNWDGTGIPGQPGADGVPDVWEKNYNVKVTMVNAITGEVIDPSTSGDPNYFAGKYFNKNNNEFEANDPKNQTGVYDRRDALAITPEDNWLVAPTGWKLLNPEEVTKNFQVLDDDVVVPDDVADALSGQYNSGEVVAHKGEIILKTMGDVDMTLYYAPISPVEIKYNAQEQDENGNTVEKTLVTYTTNTNGYALYDNLWNKEILDAKGNPIPYGDTKINAYALDIPGFELVGKPTWSGVDNQTVTKDGTNPFVITFEYKKNSKNEDSKSLTGGAILPSDENIDLDKTFGAIDSWKYLNGDAPINATFGEMYPGLAEALAAQAAQFEKQGLTQISNANEYTADEVMPSNVGMSNRNWVNNKAVTVHYVDQDGNALADDVILASNPNNPDQTNQGVNEAESWYPEGEWTAPKKKIAGYHVSKTYGEDHGKFLPWMYEVTYEYAKDTTPDEAHLTVNFIDQTDNNKVLQSVPIQGTIGSEIKYDPATTIKAYEGAGYELVSNGFTEAGKEYSDTNNGKTYDIILKHGTQPVNPENPGAGYTKTQLQDEVTRTITYVGVNGTNAPATVTQTTGFSASGTMDKVTGKLVTLNADGTIANEDGKLTWTPDSVTLDGVKTPVVENYHVVSVSSDSKDGVNVDQITVNHDSADSTVIVKYAPNGHIIPTDPEGHVIPNAPQPQYPTDPKNPGGVTPDEPVPEVPGYTPEKSTVTPPNPSEDTPVIYHKDEVAASITVRYIDQSDDNKVLDSTALAGTVGSAIDTKDVDTKITDYEKEGYVLVSNGFEEAGKDFTDANNGKTYDIIFKHGTTPINPNQPGIPGEPITTPEGPKFPEGTSKEDLERTVTRTITYVANGQAQDKPFVAPETVTQNIKFTAEGTIDNVTGNLVTVDAAGNITSQDGKLTWTPEDGTLKAVNSPVVNYYHVVSVSADSKDNVNVDATTVNHESNNINVVVTYAPNGHVIPVDPNGHEIPDVPPTDLPPYPTDPTNPSKVVPNVPIPEVPGYTPDIPGKDQTVPTPPNPSDDVKVPYVKQDNPPVVNNDEVAGLVSYIDDTTGKTLASEKLEGKVGEKISYTTTATITKYVNEGYDFVSSNFVNGDESFTSGSNVFEVHFTEGTVPVNPQKPGKPGEPLNPDDPNGNGPKYPAGTDEKSLNKTVIRTIKFVDSNGNEVANSITQSAHFTASGVLNKVTGEWVTPLTWTPDKEELASVNVPVVEKQHVVSIDKDGNGLTSVNGVSVTHENDSYTVTVTYAPNGHIIPVDPNGEPIKNVPTPPYTTDPHNPSQVVPNEPVPEIPGYTPNQSTVTPPNPGEDTPVIYVPTTPTTPTDPNPTPEPHPEPNPDTDVPDIPAPEVPSVDVPMPHPQTPEVPEEPDETPAPHATTPETPVSEDEGEVPVVHASDNEDVPMPHAAQEALPQTGEKTSVMAVIAGAFASVLGIFGLASRKKEDK